MIDMRRHAVFVKGHPVNLAYTEFELLSLLATRPGWAFSRARIVDAIRGFNCAVTDRSVDVQIVGLRRELGPYGEYSQTVRGVGYRFKAKTLISNVHSDDTNILGLCSKTSRKEYGFILLQSIERISIGVKGKFTGICRSKRSSCASGNGDVPIGIQGENLNAAIF